MPKSAAQGSGSGTSGKEGTALSGTRAVTVAAVVAVLGSAAAAYLFLRARSASPYAGRMRGGCLIVPVDADPRASTQLALRCIRDCYEKHGIATASTASSGTSPSADATLSTVSGLSLGQLVYALRGEPGMTFEGYNATNAHRHRLPLTFIQYIEDNYLRSTKQLGSAAAPTSLPTASSSSSAPALAAVERGMMQALVELDFGFRCLEKYRATPFNNNDRTHVNLLQQLWVAAGNPAATFQRTGSQWAYLGFQGDDPATDLRGAGMLGLRQFVHFAQSHPDAFQEMLAFNKRTLAAKKDSWYLLAVVSLQMTAHLTLERDVTLFPAHLEVLYDSLTPLSSNSGNLLRGGTGMVSGATVSGVSRRAAALKLNSHTLADPRVWQCVAQATAANPSSASAASSVSAVWCGDAEAGMNALHHQLMLHFKMCWERDEPHVMEYNTYTPEKVYSTFFCASWKPSTVGPQSSSAVPRRVSS